MPRTSGYGCIRCGAAGRGRAHGGTVRGPTRVPTGTSTSSHYPTGWPPSYSTRAWHFSQIHGLNPTRMEKRPIRHMCLSPLTHLICPFLSVNRPSTHRRMADLFDIVVVMDSREKKVGD